MICDKRFTGIGSKICPKKQSNFLTLLFQFYETNFKITAVDERKAFLICVRRNFINQQGFIHLKVITLFSGGFTWNMGVLSPLEITTFLWVSLFGTYLFYWFKKTKANWAEFEGTEGTNLGSIYLFKVNNKNSRTICESCSKLTIKTREQFYTLLW